MSNKRKETPFKLYWRYWVSPPRRRGRRIIRTREHSREVYSEQEQKLLKYGWMTVLGNSLDYRTKGKWEDNPGELEILTPNISCFKLLFNINNRKLKW